MFSKDVFNFRYIYLHKIRYLDGLKLQKSLVQYNIKEKNNAKPTLLLLQHFPVYTVGLRSFLYDKFEENRLKELGADFVQTDRGGLITFHGPGQLVVYPILNLNNFRFGVRKFVDLLEEVVIRVCSELDVAATRSPHTGVWVNNNKVCAMGINVTRSITSHGLALNCDTDLDWFNHIVPCGIQGKGVTSLSECLNRRIAVDDVIPMFVRIFSQVFQIKCNGVEFIDETTSLDEKIQYIQ